MICFISFKPIRISWIYLCPTLCVLRTNRLEKELVLIFMILISCASSEEMPGGAWQGAHTPKGSAGHSGDGKVQHWEGKAPEMGSSMDGQHPKPTVQPPWALVAPTAYLTLHGWAQHLFTTLKQHFVSCPSWFYRKFCHGNVHHRWPQVTTANKTLPPLELHPFPSSRPLILLLTTHTNRSLELKQHPSVGEVTLSRMNQLHLSQLSFHSWKIRGRDFNVSKWKKIKNPDVQNPLKAAPN